MPRAARAPRGNRAHARRQPPQGAGHRSDRARPRAIRALNELDEAQERQRTLRARLDALRDQRNDAPRYQRAEGRDLDRAIAANEHATSSWDDHVDELCENLGRRISRPREPGSPEPARDPLAGWLDPASTVAPDLADIDRDLGP
jgi:hypothetical protein